MNDMRKEVDHIFQIAKNHQKLFEDSIPMIASENVLSPLALQMMITDFHGRYAEGNPGARYYQGNEFVDEMEIKAVELAKELFGCSYADVRPTSGTVANLGMLFALMKPGETMTTLSVADGAHISTAQFGAVGVRSVNPVTYPFDQESMNIDVEKTKKLLKEVKPKLALFGRSVFLFPTPLEELRDTLEEIDATVWYDGAHVLGLIAGGQFQDPLREGAHLVTGSTHKTLPGPQRGVLFGNPRSEEMETSLNYGMFPGVLSNHHLHTVAALAVALAEHLEFGKQYAAQTVKNAQALAQALYERGFDVVGEHLGFTKSHTVSMYIKRYSGGKKAVEDLEKANIITNKNLMPGDESDQAQDPSGIRLGSQEMTRIGMKENEMVAVAEFFKRILIDKEDPLKVGAEVREFKSNFQKIHFCFNSGTKAYEWPEIKFS